MIVTVLYKYICFDLRATVGCFVASNLANLPQRLFLNAHVWDSRYIKTYPSHSARELSDPGGVRVSLMSSFKAFAGRLGLVLMFVGKAGWHNLRGYR